MPIFDAHKAVYVHIPKSGGTSILKLLSDDFKKLSGSPNKVSLSLMYGRNLQHLTASKLRFIAPIRFRKYYKFAFTRHPLDRMRSEYRWRRKWDRDLKGQSFSDMLEQIPVYRKKREPHFISSCDFIYNKDRELLVDFVGRFETLSHDFSIVADKLGVNTVLPHTNKTTKGKESPQEEATELEKSILLEYFRDDFDILGYEIK